MRIKITDDFDLNKISTSGQCFRVKKFQDGFFRFITGTHILYIRNLSQHNFEVSCDLEEWEKIWVSYFDLKRNYQAIRKSIPAKDHYMTIAASEGEGIRILRQDPWEMLLTFIISQRKSIPSIANSVEILSVKFGTLVQTDRESIYLFPTPTQLTNASDEELVACKLGYRVSYIHDAVASVTKRDLDLYSLESLSDKNLFETLKNVKGVGNKIANCVCLFAYGRVSMAPVDTWISKIISTAYQGKNPFPGYGNVAGIMQQFAFYHAQNHKKEFQI